MFMYTVEPPYFELIGNKLKLSWLQTFPLFRIMGMEIYSMELMIL